MEDNARHKYYKYGDTKPTHLSSAKGMQIFTIKAFCFKKSLLVKNLTSWQKGGGSQHASSWTSGQIYCFSFGFNVC